MHRKGKYSMEVNQHPLFSFLIPALTNFLAERAPRPHPRGARGTGSHGSSVVLSLRDIRMRTFCTRHDIYTASQTQTALPLIVATSVHRHWVCLCCRMYIGCSVAPAFVVVIVQCIHRGSSRCACRWVVETHRNRNEKQMQAVSRRCAVHEVCMVSSLTRRKYHRQHTLLKREVVS